MKTPFDNFELFIDDTYRETSIGIGNKEFTLLHGIKVWLQHKTLPIKIMYQHLGKTPIEEIRSKVIEKVYSTLIEMYLYGKAQTLFDEGNVYQIVNGKTGYMYYPEWDKEENKWFVLDEKNNRLYE